MNRPIARTFVVGTVGTAGFGDVPLCSVWFDAVFMLNACLKIHGAHNAGSPASVYAGLLHTWAAPPSTKNSVALTNFMHPKPRCKAKLCSRFKNSLTETLPSLKTAKKSSAVVSISFLFRSPSTRFPQPRKRPRTSRYKWPSRHPLWRDLSSPRNLGPVRLSQPDLFPRGRSWRLFCRLGRAPLFSEELCAAFKPLRANLAQN